MGKAIPLDPVTAELIHERQIYQPPHIEEAHDRPLPHRKAINEATRLAMEGFITPPERSDK